MEDPCLPPGFLIFCKCAVKAAAAYLPRKKGGTTMKKLLFAIFFAASIATGNQMAQMMFGPIDPVMGGEEVTSCAILAGMAYYIVYEVIKRPLKERLAVRAQKRARELEEKQFLETYETYRREFLEGRGVIC